jgi:peptide/nickel transport system permease protein
VSKTLFRVYLLTVDGVPELRLAVVAGCSKWKIMRKHILPNVINSAIVLATLQLGQVIIAEAALSFLGVGVPPVLPTWGSMISSGQQFAHQAIWLVVFPGIAIILSALSLQMVGDGFRDLLDPKLRKAL